MKGSFEAEFNDNINYSNQNRESDLILRPGLSLSAFYQVSEINSLSLDLGIAYEQYLLHPHLSSYTNFASVSPDSQLAYTILVKNFTIKLYDSFSYSVQPSDAFAFNPTTGQVITSVNAYGRFMNQVGVNVDWDLKRVVIYGGAYRYDVFPQQSSFQFLRRWQYTYTLGMRYMWLPNLTVGLASSYTTNYYEQNFQNNSDSWFVGPNVAWVPSPNWSVRANGGYVFYDFLPTGSNGDTSQPSTFTGELSITNKLSKTLDHTLTISRTTNFGYVSNTVDVNRIAYQIAWQFRPKKWTAKLWTYYEWGNDSGGPNSENYTKFSISPEVDYDMNKKTTFYLYYEFTDKESNFSSRVYDRNRVVLGVRYEF